MFRAAIILANMCAIPRLLLSSAQSVLFVFKCHINVRFHPRRLHIVLALFALDAINATRSRRSSFKVRAARLAARTSIRSLNLLCETRCHVLPNVINLVTALGILYITKEQHCAFTKR
jgi:hypothetical protein